MDKYLPLFFFAGPYMCDPEYYDLNEEEKSYVDYFNECLMDPEDDFKDACTEVLFLMLELTQKINTGEELSDEEIQKRKQSILNGFNEENKKRLETFMYACIQSMGIYSEQRVQERKLRKERK